VTASGGCVSTKLYRVGQTTGSYLKVCNFCTWWNWKSIIISECSVLYQFYHTKYSWQ